MAVARGGGRAAAAAAAADSAARLGRGVQDIRGGARRRLPAAPRHTAQAHAAHA